MAVKTLLPLCLLVSSVIATPIQIRSSPVTLPIAIKINSTGGPQALVNRDRARARALFAHGQAKAQGKSLADVPVPVTDVGTTYIATVGVGAGTYSLLVDTGSSNTWVGAGERYQPGPKSHNTGSTVSVKYGSGSFSGKEFTDDVKLGSATIHSQSIGVASRSTGFDGVDGILGVGPLDLTEGTVKNTRTVPTVTDNLLSQGFIDQALIGMSFVPTTSRDDPNGKLNFGGVDSSKFTGDISFVPITTTSPASLFWGIDQNITYGSAHTPILRTTAGVVDTGTTLTMLASDAFKRYQKATDARLDETTGLLTVSSENNLQSLFFNIGGLTPNAQMWPRALNTQIGGQAGSIYLIVSDTGNPSGEGLDFIIGFTFLQRFYSVFDTTHSRVGLATTRHTHDTSN